MEIALNPTSASDPIDQTRPQDDVAAGDDAFGMLLAMALQSAVIVTSQAPPADATPDPATTSAEMDAGPDGTGAANGVSAPARLDSDVTGPIPSGPQSAPAQAANAEVSLYFEESPEVINLEQIAETLGRPQNAGPQVPASASAVDPDGLLDADGLQTPSPGANPPTEEAHHLGFGVAASRDVAPAGEGVSPATDSLADRDEGAASHHPDARPQLRVDGLLGPAQPAAEPASVVHTSATHSSGGPSLVHQIADGLQLALDRSGSAVHLRLQPEGLGEVHLQVASGDAGLVIHIAADDPSTLDLIQAAVGQLSQNLESRGLAVAHLLVDLSSGQSGQRDGTQQQFAQQSGSRISAGQGLTTSDSDGASGDEVVASNRVDYRV